MACLHQPLLHLHLVLEKGESTSQRRLLCWKDKKIRNDLSVLPCLVWKRIVLGIKILHQFRKVQPRKVSSDKKGVKYLEAERRRFEIVGERKRFRSRSFQGKARRRKRRYENKNGMLMRMTRKMN